MSTTQQGDFYCSVCMYRASDVDCEPAQTRQHVLPEQAQDPVSDPPNAPSELCHMITCDCCTLTGASNAIAKSLASADESSGTLTGCCHCCRSCVTVSSCRAAARLWLSSCRPHRTSPVNCWSTCPAAMLQLPSFRPRWATLPTLIQSHETVVIAVV